MSSQARIQVLPDNVANKIAAGEVVERPASIVKELMENAVDAGGSQIDVEIVLGGRKLVAVSDNGSGMIRDDALLSLERHATSKIRDVDDIERINTLGFRGEALAAMASVSRFRLVTCTGDDPSGTEILVSGGKIYDVKEIGAPRGTRIEIRDLFFNVPARRKFLRAQQTELSYVRMGFIRQGLSHAAIGMSLKVDDRDVYRLPGGGTLEDRLRDLFGPEYGEKLVAIDGLRPGLRVHGYVGRPSLHRSDRNEQFIFINGRATSAPVISRAIREGYHTLLAGDRHPSVFIFIDIDPDLVDVNVHPTKKEVRFRRSNDVRDGVIEAIRAALGHPDAQASMVSADSPGNPLGRMTPGVRQHAQLEILNLPPTRVFDYPGMHPDVDPVMEPSGKSQDSGESATPGRHASSAPWTWCRVVGQVGGLYVLLETEDGYVIMDPHASHERVLFEKFMKEVTDSKVGTQGLLIPETVELAPGDALRVRKNLSILKEMGFGISDFGADAFLVDALPTHFSGTSARAILIEVAHHLEQAGARGGKGRWREESIAQAACKTAVKARDRLSLEEIERLVIDLALTEMPYTCPHGRPTMIYTPFRELHRKFSRE